ncbi:MAG: sigma-70 family RNA polymerase sigma factor [Fibrobacter sp.]|nr:sigma-70 family RNA polymerase sigma factor [Fibrobacter sp.]
MQYYARMMVEKCFQRYIWYKTEILELESYIQTLDLDSETRAHVTRILTSLKQDRDTLRNAIAGEHAEFALRIARKYHHENMDLEDFFQEAHQALLKSIETYDPTYGVPFEAYAYIWIRKTLSHLVESECGLIRVPDSLVRQRRKDKQSPTVFTYECYEDRVSDGEPTPEEIQICRRTRDYLNACITNLDDTRRKILQKRYMSNKLIPNSLEEVARECGLTREKTRLLEKSALQRLTRYLEQSKTV